LNALVSFKSVLTFEGYRAGRIRPKRQFWFPFSPTALKKSGRHRNPMPQ